MDELPNAIGTVVAALFDKLPLSQSMGQLVVTLRGDDEMMQLAGGIVRQPVIALQPALAAGLWLYVDELAASHRISQGIDDATGAFWHGIMHRREGDFSNSHYWFSRAGDHPAMELIDGYDGHQLIDQVEAAHRRGETLLPLIKMQQREWTTLFAWCAQQG